jgi:aconitate hydratase
MLSKNLNSYNTLEKLSVNNKDYYFYNITKLDKDGYIDLSKFPFSIRVLLENVLRNEDDKLVTKNDILKLIQYNAKNIVQSEIPYMPARVILQDFTGVPAVVDLASMRESIKKLGGDPNLINPIVKSDLVIDHSIQVDQFGTNEAYLYNVKKEYERNKERYRLLKWAQKSYNNFNVVPPSTGIIHQVNLEYLGSVVMEAYDEGNRYAFPDTLVGTDSHTTMINGLSILGWGVGGIEAEAVMLGQPYYMLLPKVVGVKLLGMLPEGTTATDLVLTITEMLRKHGVVGKFVEYFGSGLSNLGLPDRATIANMSPEYGATMGFFPIDVITLAYLKLSGKSKEHITLVENYAKVQNLFRTDQTPDPIYTNVIELDMTTIEPSLAGPKRPQDRLTLNHMKSAFQNALELDFHKGDKPIKSEYKPTKEKQLNNGSVVIAAITSCTNTSNPSVMITAGLVAKKAKEKGLKSKPWVKTSLAPGSRVVTEYLKRADLLGPLEFQGFNLVGYGCTTCIGNSGPLPEKIAEEIKRGDLVVASVTSGNRNFEGRIHPQVRANYLASPPLVVVYALAGRIDINLNNEPIGYASDGSQVYLHDIWPSSDEIAKVLRKALNAQMFQDNYAQVFKGDEYWQSLHIEGGNLYPWDKNSTYIKNPPFLEDMKLEKSAVSDIYNAHVLAKLGDSVTTDHISPAGTIPPNSPAGQYLVDKGVQISNFNSFGSRRGNHEVMMRGTFGNIRIKNLLLENVEGGRTLYLPTGEETFIYDAAIKYKNNNIPLIILAGKEYGTGSSRDWAAKGTSLLGIKAVIAESYERIHRSNLIGMGVLPLQFKEGENHIKLNLSGKELYNIYGIAENLYPGKELKVKSIREDNSQIEFSVITRLDTPIEVEYYLNGGILQTVLRQIIK